MCLRIPFIFHEWKSVCTLRPSRACCLWDEMKLHDFSILICGKTAKFFRTRPDQPWGPPSLLYNGYRVSFPVVRRPGRGVGHSHRLAPRSKKEYSYTSISLLGLHSLF
jgi:hypothetical protein